MQGASSEPGGARGIRWSVERRLAFIEFRLYWDDRVNRRDLVEFFGISVPQASADLRMYQELAPGNIEYDRTARTYVASAGFAPALQGPSAEQYFGHLHSLVSGVVDRSQSWLGNLPPTDIVKSLRRHAEAHTIRMVLKAIRAGGSLNIEYLSLSRATPIWRWISPHALAHDGYRWHARAWCHKHGDFRDFVIGRMVKIGSLSTSDADVTKDLGWDRIVTFRIEPHPGLSEGNRRAIEADFEMKDGYTEVNTRVCLSNYLERYLGLDLEVFGLPPKRQQIVLANREEVERARRETDSDWNRSAAVAP